MSLICSNCQTENAPGAKFCTECAAPMARTCPNCGTANVAGAKFCAECATPLAAGASPGAGTGSSSAPITAAPSVGGQAASAHVAERRLVSVLFADLVGFTPFAEERDAEEVREWSATGSCSSVYWPVGRWLRR